MALTWNAHKTHVEYPWNTHCIHREYTWHVIHMVCTWDTKYDTHSILVHMAHTHTLHAWNAHGLHMVCTFSTPALHMASHGNGIHRLLRMLAPHASHVIYSINLSAYLQDSFPPCWSFPFPFGHVHVERIVGGSSFGHDLRNWRRWRLPRPW